jgi:hypothetical protein
LIVDHCNQLNAIAFDFSGLSPGRTDGGERFDPPGGAGRPARLPLPAQPALRAQGAGFRRSGGRLHSWQPFGYEYPLENVHPEKRLNEGKLLDPETKWLLSLGVYFNMIESQ